MDQDKHDVNVWEKLVPNAELHPSTLLRLAEYWRNQALEARKECLEQAKLNGIGSQREAALLSEIVQLRRQIK